jgi:hypothetical protein
MSHLADLARHLVAPDEAVTTGWPKVRDTCHNLGWTFDEWQDDLGRQLLSKRTDGLYAASISAMSLPRQVGKTYLVGCIAFALCLTQPGTTVIWTAHRGRTATETFRAMKAKAKTPELAAFIDQRVKGGGIRSSNGEQEIEFLNGSRILFGAREAGFGVGFANVGMLVIDEVQRAQTKTMDDLLPTTNAAANPLVLCMGTPPRPTDDGEVFSMLRHEAIAGESGDVLYVELGASGRFDLNDDVEFWRQLRNVNPSFPHRVGERAILRNKKGLGEDSVFREVFGLWDEVDANGERPIPLDLWTALAIPDAEVPQGAPDRFALTMSPERVASIAVALKGEAADYLDLAELERVDDSRKLIDWLASRCGRRIPVMIDSRDPAASFVNELRTRGVKVNVTSASDAGRACGGLLDAVSEGRPEGGDGLVHGLIRIPDLSHAEQRAPSTSWLSSGGRSVPATTSVRRSTT